jgi:hypothetical protein
MSIKTIAKSISNKSALPLLKLRRSSPQLFFVGGVIGVVAAGVLACKATLKVEAILDNADSDLKKTKAAAELEEYSEKDRYQDVAVVYGRTALALVKLYGPAVIVGAVSISALAGSHVILARRNAATSAALLALSEGFNKYRGRVSDRFGPEAERDILFDMREHTITEEGPDGPVTKTIKTVGPESSAFYARLFDENSKNWKREHLANQLFLKCQENWANMLLQAQGYLFLNDVYKSLGIAPSAAGQKVGWVLNGGNSDNYVDFGIFEFDKQGGIDFINGDSLSVWINPNVDGEVYQHLDM